MSESANSSLPSPTLALGKWLGLVVSAVVLAEGIWTTIVSLTKGLLLPLMARAIGGDAQSPLGKGDFNTPDLFVSLVELCLAGIVFLSIKSWVTRAAPGARRVRRAAPAQVLAEKPAIVPPAEAPRAAPVASSPLPPPPPSAIPQVLTAPSAPEPSPAPVPPPPSSVNKADKPKKPEKPKEVYYNIVGEPINPAEDE
ncbi:MAG TPA: hypothetical protein VEK33_04080 [Terriglobales bacterium]|nr:hypothetical protein [Terriglobales bacterium]